MALDSAYHATASDAKKPPPTADAGDHHIASPTGLAGNKIEQEGVLGAWTKDLLKEGSQAWHGFTNMVSHLDGGDKTNPNVQHVDNISSLTFDNVFGKHATDGKHAPAEAKTDSTKDGKAHVTETNDHGVTTDVTATKGYISGQVGDAHIDQNKKTHETKYTNKDGFKADVTTHGESVKGPNGDTTTWNNQTHEGQVTGTDGKPILRMHANGDLTHQLSPHSELTQTNGDAATTAAAVRAQEKANGTPRDKTRIFEDNKGNVAIMRQDGLDVTTNKATGDVTMQKDGHTIVVHDGKASAQVVGEDGKTHMVPMQAGDQLPNGMKVANDGSVAVDGKTVVDSKGHVQVDEHTAVDTKKGAVTAQTDSGAPVQTSSDGHTTTVNQAGVGNITNDGTSYHNTDTATQGVFKDWNPQAQTYDVGGPGQSGAHFDTSQNGGVTMTDSNGQNTSIWNNGVVNAIDSFGDALFGIDQSGNSFFGDGSSISNSGTIYNSDGSSDGSAWTSSDSSGSGIDPNASSDISDASAAVDFANDGGTVDPTTGDPLVTGAVTGDATTDLTTAPGVNTDATVLANLGTQDADLGDEIGANVGKKGSANLIANLQDAQSRVEGTESNVSAKLVNAEEATPPGSAAVTRLMASGMSRDEAMNVLSARGNDTAEAA